MLLQDKMAVINGTGGAVACASASEGATLFLTGRHRAPVEVVAKDIVADGGSAEAAEVDRTTPPTAPSGTDPRSRPSSFEEAPPAAAR
jgi:short-subunit dehydrogenase